MAGLQQGSAVVKMERGVDFPAFYDATCGAAHSLALRITGDQAAAASACEAAYLGYWRNVRGAAGLAIATQTDFLQGVRAQALLLRSSAPGAGAERSNPPQSTYTQGERVRAGLQELDQFTRRTLELAYFGGLAVAEIAEIVGRSTIEIRQALRTALLTLGRLAPPPEETGR